MRLSLVRAIACLSFYLIENIFGRIFGSVICFSNLQVLRERWSNRRYVVLECCVAPDLLEAHWCDGQSLVLRCWSDTYRI